MSGVIGAVSRMVGRCTPGGRIDPVMQTIAGRAIADLIVILQADDEPMQRKVRRIASPGASRMHRVLTGEEPALLNRPCELVGRSGEVCVIAVRVAREMAPHDVMEIVGPDRVESPAAEADRFDERGEVPVILGVDHDRPRRGAAHDVGDLRDDVYGAVVDECVGRVEAQPVERGTRAPSAAALSRMKRRTSIRAVAVEIDRRAPRRVVAVGEIVRIELRQVGAFGSEMVVDDVEDHGEAVLVCRVDEAPQILRDARSSRDGAYSATPSYPQFRVPAKSATGISSIAVTPRSRRAASRSRAAGERSIGCERADVQLVDDELLRRGTSP